MSAARGSQRPAQCSVRAPADTETHATRNSLDPYKFNELATDPYNEPLQLNLNEKKLKQISNIFETIVSL